MEKEIWKSISGYLGLYEVSNLGRIRSVDRFAERRNGMITGKILVARCNRTGYLRVCLCKDNIKKFKLVHRLVAMAFLPNTQNFPQVNHKDENKQNNEVENLEWCTAEYNQNYKNCPLKKRLSRIENFGKGVCSYDEKGNKIKDYLCVSDVQNDGFIRRNVVQCCKGERRTCGGLFWAFEGCQPIIRKQYARRKNL